MNEIEGIKVSILVLVDDFCNWRVKKHLKTFDIHNCFNPCFGRRLLQLWQRKLGLRTLDIVSILVLVDDFCNEE